MGATISVNARTVVHKGSEGHAMGTGDMCKTPKSDDPVPYVNVARSEDAANTCKTVFCDGYAVMNQASHFAQSYGDEPGTSGGVISGCNRGKASFITASLDVSFEGAPAPRAFDSLIGNHGSPGNVLLPRWIQELFESFPWERVVICIHICNCWSNMASKMNCFVPQMGVRRWASPKGSRRRGFAYDPSYPGMYIEVTFVLSSKGEWVPKMSTAASVWPSKSGRPMRLPYGSHIPGSVRPDVVVVRDPEKPVGPGNIKAIYEVKFPGDSMSERQESLYPEVARMNGATFTVLDVATCGCKPFNPLPHRLREKLPDPRIYRGKEEPWTLPPIPIRIPLPGPRPVPPLRPVPVPLFPIVLPSAIKEALDKIRGRKGNAPEA